jgi:hypothetical protein
MGGRFRNCRLKNACGVEGRRGRGIVPPADVREAGCAVQGITAGSYNPPRGKRRGNQRHPLKRPANQAHPKPSSCHLSSNDEIVLAGEVPKDLVDPKQACCD